MKRKWWIVGILAFLELVVCGAVLLVLWAGRDTLEELRFFYVADTHVEETVEETFTVDGPVVLDLENVSGDVTVRGGAEDQVQMTARLSLWGEDEEDAHRQAEVQTTQEGNQIAIRVVRPDWGLMFGMQRGSSVDFEISVPAETSLRLESISGDLTVSGITGTVNLKTVSGNIRADDVTGAVNAGSTSGNLTLVGLNDAGDMEARTISGDLTLRDVTGDSLTAHSSSGQVQVEEGTLSGGLDLESISGDVTATGIRAAAYRLDSSSGDLALDGCSGPLNLRTVSGKIEVSHASDAGLALGTSSGRIRFSGSLSAQGEHQVETVSGEVRLVLPAGAAFDLDIETVSGAIQTDFPVTMTQFGKRHVTGKVNGGGPPLRINTSSGDVALLVAPDEGD